MKNRKRWLWVLLAAALLLSGCSMQTVGQMYQLPKRPEDFSNLQSVIDSAMTNMDFCAPLTGENQQNVHMADLDGDGEQEYLLFAKSNDALPLRILLFKQEGEKFLHLDTIMSNGAAFDQVEYIQMDDKPGVEIVVGRQVSDQLVRAVSVYTFDAGETRQLLSVNYRKFVAADINQDGLGELFVLRPGQDETDSGYAEFYTVKNGVMLHSNEAGMSAPVQNLKRILVGKLHDGKTAVYVASTVGDRSLITDVYTVQNLRLTNVSLSAESGTSIQTLRNSYVYADDIDHDGIVELPSLIAADSEGNAPNADQRGVICWYAMDSNGNTVEKLYTYYEAVGGWYLKLNEKLAHRITVRCVGNAYEFYLWHGDFTVAQKLMTVYALTGQNREEQSIADGRFVLLKTDLTTYSAKLENAAGDYYITQQSVINNFHLIHRHWNTGET